MKSLAGLMLAGGLMAAAVSLAGPLDRRSNSGFVTQNGTRLYQYGKPLYISGMNYWSCMNLAADDKAGGNRSRFEVEMKQLSDAGINMIRIMASSDGSNVIQPNRMYPALLESPYHWNEDIFIGLDRCMARAADLGMTVILTLQNTWNWSGGMGQLVSWTTDNGTIPYPPSWDYTKGKYGDYTTNGTWQGYINYTSTFYNNTAAQDLYRAHIHKVITRKNTVNGRMYSNDPAVLAYELANEPQPPFPYSWVDGTAQYIKSLAPKSLITTGFEGKQGEMWWKLIHKSPHISLCSGHWWVQNQAIYDPNNSTAINLNLAISTVTTFLANISSWASDLNKPVILEEAGMARDQWQNVARGAPNNSYLYNSTATTANCDAYFGVILSEILGYFKRDQALVGFAPWAYGGIWRPLNRRNRFNEEWAGDPPHEAPGWYDLYDKDASTLALLKNTAQEAERFSQSQ